MYVEAIAVQSVAVQNLSKELALWKHTIVPVHPEKDKEARAKFALRLASLGCVFMLCPDAAHYPVWAKDFLNELAAFSSGERAKDDQVDAFTQIVNKWATVIDAHLVQLPTQYLVTAFTGPAKPKNPAVRERIPEFKEDPFSDGIRTRDLLGWRQRRNVCS
jgi:hypothetical protein